MCDKKTCEETQSKNVKPAISNKKRFLNYRKDILVKKYCSINRTSMTSDNKGQIQNISVNPLHAF